MEVQGNKYETYGNCERGKGGRYYEFTEVDYVVVSGGYWDNSGVACDHGADVGADADEDEYVSEHKNGVRNRKRMTSAWESIGQST